MMYLTTHSPQLAKHEVAEWTRDHFSHIPLPSTSTTTSTTSGRNRHTEMSRGSLRAFTFHPTGLIDIHCRYLNPSHTVVTQTIRFYRAFVQKGKTRLRRGVIILLRLNVPPRPITRTRHPWASDSRNHSLLTGCPHRTHRNLNILFTILRNECPSQMPASIALRRLRDNRNPPGVRICPRPSCSSIPLGRSPGRGLFLRQAILLVPGDLAVPHHI